MKRRTSCAQLLCVEFGMFSPGFLHHLLGFYFQVLWCPQASQQQASRGTVSCDGLASHAKCIPVSHLAFQELPQDPP